MPSSHDGPDVTLELQTLDEPACRELLAARDLGRLAFLVGDQPQVTLVNYHLRPNAIVCRVHEGETLANSPLTRVAFEVDDIDYERHVGWSVVVHGVAFEVTDTLDSESEFDRALRVPTWAPGTARDLRIDIKSVTGRRLVRIAPEPDGGAAATG